ncbi:hypothetical protein GUJ93_ZPchr0002g25725 [Zizania palustris]|uniref:Uncharacterized protein n=1 Tax=Zizania palustris TaxID=103762 RepID=A0A8J5SAB0_ZIZPA|nr:hypothetical protein GUJ93_ZPchr0002g25725 [Zizania palustris]
MDSGKKTHTYLSTVPGMFAGARYDYDFGKTHNDMYVLPAGGARRRAPGQGASDMFYGFLNPCHNSPERQYMSGMGYIDRAVSWDVTEWIAATGQPTKIHDGPEEKVFEQCGWGGAARGRTCVRRAAADRCTITWAWRRGQKAACLRHVRDHGEHRRRAQAQRPPQALTFFNATLPGRGVKLSKLT